VFRWLGRQLFPVWVIVWLNGVILRLTVRDSVDLVAPLYYATPWPVLAILTLPFIGVVWRNPKMVLSVLVVAHLFAGAWIFESWRTNDPARGTADLKVVHWNVDRPIRRLRGTAVKIRQFDADIVTIAEPMPKDRKVTASRIPELKDEWRNEFPDYQVVFADGNLLVLVRGEITSERHEELAPGSFYSLYDIRVKDHSFRLLQVDIIAKPTKSRRAPLTALAQIADSLQDQPLVIAGDFNTPRDSVFLKPLRTHHSNSWEKAGIRDADTWPWPVPVLSLDQIWSNDRLKPLRCQTAGNWRSDHLWVEAEFVFQQ
jgi:endonuclease/exonuclease/phosphatase (EEP) superfamily protein YafD